MPVIVIARRVSPEILTLLSESFVVVPNMTSAALTRDELLRRARDAHAVVVNADDVVDGDFLRQCPHVLIVASTFNGPGFTDVDACTERGVWFTTVDGVPPQTTAELEALSNVFEALTGERPKGALNEVSRRRVSRAATTRVANTAP
jgi:phosphonate dehydrogenase